MKAAGHFKAYINPCLDTLNEADLGFHIGPIAVGTECCADDTYLQSDTQSGLQNALNIVSHYARRYRVLFNADKTKVVVTGSTSVQSAHGLSMWRELMLSPTMNILV